MKTVQIVNKKKKVNQMKSTIFCFLDNNFLLEFQDNFTTLKIKLSYLPINLSFRIKE